MSYNFAQIRLEISRKSADIRPKIKPPGFQAFWTGLRAGPCGLSRPGPRLYPSQVYAEQALSVAARPSFVPNRRSRLTDVSIDDLCFEKAYFDTNGYLLELINISMF